MKKMPEIRIKFDEDSFEALNRTTDALKEVCDLLNNDIHLKHFPRAAKKEIKEILVKNAEYLCEIIEIRVEEKSIHEKLDTIIELLGVKNYINLGRFENFEEAELFTKKICKAIEETTADKRINVDRT